jgi:putative endonuclease
VIDRPRSRVRPSRERRRDDNPTALGRRAELAVADYLVARGFRVLARNVRVGSFEIDVVARRDDLVVAVEVRTRGARSFEGPLESIGRAKQRRMLAAAERLWRDHLEKAPDVGRLRIDVASVIFRDGQTLVEYLEGAVTGT